MSEVQKTGSLWTGEVVAVDSQGNLVTNFSVADIRPLMDSAKLWFEYKNQEGTLRGLANPSATIEKGRLFAREGGEGTVEISLSGGSAAQKTGLKPGDSIQLHFRT